MPDGNPGDKILRVLMRFGLDQSSADQVSKALADQEADVKDLITQWDNARKTIGLTEAETVKMIQSSITGQKLNEAQILAVGHAYDAQAEAERQAAEKIRADQVAEVDRLKQIDDNTKLIAKSFNSMIGAGRFLSEIGRAGSIFGQLLNDNDLKRIGQLTTGIGDLVMAAGRLPQAFQAFTGLSASLGAAASGIASMAGAGTAVAGIAGTIGALALPVTAVVGGVALLISSLTDQKKSTLELSDAAKKAAEAMKPTIQSYDEIAKGFDGPIAQLKAMGYAGDTSVEGLKKARGAYQELLSAIFAAGDLGSAKWKHTADIIAGIDKAISGQQKPNLDEAAKQYDDYLKKLDAIDQKGRDERLKIDDDTQAKLVETDKSYTDKRIKILMDDATQEARTETSNNKARLKLAEQYGVDILRMEQAHQLEMQRLSEDHGKRLRKLAESRDALGIEDENDAYATEKKRAEEDYQIKAGQRNEDYARQLRDLTDSQNEQAKYRQEDKAKQLAELDKQHKDEMAKITKSGTDKKNELEKQLADERANANDQWTQWRHEHDIFFDGEKAAWDAYLVYIHNQLQRYMEAGTGNPLLFPNDPAAPGDIGAYTSPSNTAGGGTGGRVAGGLSTQAAQAAMANIARSQTSNQYTIALNFGGTNATPAMIENAVYAGIAKVQRAASAKRAARP